VTEGLALHCALKFTETATCEEVPQDFPRDENEDVQLAWLRRLADRVVDRCWLPYRAADLRVASSFAKAPLPDDEDDDVADPYGFCTCQQGMQQFVETH